jgi:dCMP deaminase
MSKWDARFIALASLVASWSKDPSTQVGAVIVDQDKRIVSTGFNGFPQGVNDAPVDREVKLLRTIHAEENALLFARRNVTGMTIYVTRPPCARCAAKLVQSGIARVVYPLPPVDFIERWEIEMHQAQLMFNECGTQITALGE